MTMNNKSSASEPQYPKKVSSFITSNFAGEACHEMASCPSQSPSLTRPSPHPLTHHQSLFINDNK